MADDPASFLRRGVAAAHGHADFRRGKSHGRALFGDAGQWRFEVFRHVHAKRLQRGDVQDRDATPRLLRRSRVSCRRCRGMLFGTVRGIVRSGGPFRVVLPVRGAATARHQMIDGGKERAQGLAGTCGCHDQHIFSGTYGRPCLPLHVGGTVERMVEPRHGGLGEQPHAFAHMFDYVITVRRHVSFKPTIPPLAESFPHLIGEPPNPPSAIYHHITVCDRRTSCAVSRA